MQMRRRRRRRLRVELISCRQLDLSTMAPFLLEGDRIESMLTGPELLRLYVWKKRVMRRGCVNKTLFKSVHREDVWLRSLKQDSEEDRTIVLKNEWAEKKWKMMHAGEVEVEEKESEEKDGEEKKEVKEDENEKKEESHTEEKTVESNQEDTNNTL